MSTPKWVCKHALLYMSFLLHKITLKAKQVFWMVSPEMYPFGDLNGVHMEGSKWRYLSTSGDVVVWLLLREGCTSDYM